MFFSKWWKTRYRFLERLCQFDFGSKTIFSSFLLKFTKFKQLGIIYTFYQFLQIGLKRRRTSKKRTSQQDRIQILTPILKVRQQY